MTYSEKLKDPRWQRKRLEILQRDSFTCQDCGDSESTLHVHHCLYIWGHDPWDYAPGELRTLCETCHSERGAVEHDVKLEFARLLAMLTTSEISSLMPDILVLREFGGPESGIAICDNGFIAGLRQRITELSANETLH
jgi:hypothetical protein